MYYLLTLVTSSRIIVYLIFFASNARNYAQNPDENRCQLHGEVTATHTDPLPIRVNKKRPRRSLQRFQSLSRRFLEEFLATSCLFESE